MKGVEGNKGYSGVALTLIDTLSTLAVIQDADRFQLAVSWLTSNVRAAPHKPPLCSDLPLIELPVTRAILEASKDCV